MLAYLRAQIPGLSPESPLTGVQRRGTDIHRSIFTFIVLKAADADGILRISGKHGIILRRAFRNDPVSLASFQEEYYDTWFHDRDQIEQFTNPVRMYEKYHSLPGFPGIIFRKDQIHTRCGALIHKSGWTAAQHIIYPRGGGGHPRRTFDVTGIPTTLATKAQVLALLKDVAGWEGAVVEYVKMSTSAQARCWARVRAETDPMHTSYKVGMQQFIAITEVSDVKSLRAKVAPRVVRAVTPTTASSERSSVTTASGPATMDTTAPEPPSTSTARPESSVFRTPAIRTSAEDLQVAAQLAGYQSQIDELRQHMTAQQTQLHAQGAEIRAHGEAIGQIQQQTEGLSEMKSVCAGTDATVKAILTMLQSQMPTSGATREVEAGETRQCPTSRNLDAGE